MTIAHSTSLSMQDVNAFILSKGYESRLELFASENEIGRITYLNQDMNFWISFKGDSGEFDCLDLFTALPVETEDADFKALNDLNAKLRAARVTLQDDKLCITQSIVVPDEGLSSSNLKKNFEIWERSFDAFVKWMTFEDETEK